MKQQLRMRAAMHKRSMEAEAREILTREMQTGGLAGIVHETPPIEVKFDHLIGIWNGRGTTDGVMQELRGED